MTDRVGIGWRGELAAGIFTNLDRIDVVEVIADDLFAAPARQLRALRTLATQVPVVLHGVGLGLASREPVEEQRLAGMARVVDALTPAFWSEHLAFVRGGGVEIGHLAAPPRTAATVEGAARNLARARAVVGSAPLVENVATLVDPPGSDRDEATWVADVLSASGSDLLLDLHNLHANAVNFGGDPIAFLDRIPAERIAAIHLAGGKRIPVPGEPGSERLLDDHLHDVPDPVYGLLGEVGRRATRPLTVILERDGAYPPMAWLLRQLDRARAALREGRSRRISRTRPSEDEPARRTEGAARIEESFLARVYVDADARQRFLADPRAEAARAGLTDAEGEALARIDRGGLALAARSFERKRARRRPPGGGWRRRLSALRGRRA